MLIASQKRAQFVGVQLYVRTQRACFDAPVCARTGE